MKIRVMHGRRSATALLLAVLGLAACGSDNDNPIAAATPVASMAPAGANVPSSSVESGVPASAGASVAAYIAYLRGLQTNETSPPVNIGAFVAPVDDTGTPTTLGG